MKGIFTLLALLVGWSAVAAQASDSGLAEHPRWKALLHINQGTTWRYQGRSYVDDPDFFCMKTGPRMRKPSLKPISTNSDRRKVMPGAVSRRVTGF